MAARFKLVKDVVCLYTFLLLVWGLYRFLFRLPEYIEEIVLKPIIWLGPVMWYLYKEKTNLSSVGWSVKNLFKNVYLGIGWGVVFGFLGILTHLFKYRGFSFLKTVSLATPDLFLIAFGLSFITAISEETVFRGFLFNRLWQVFSDEWLANLISALAWVLIHVPVGIFILHYSPPQMFVFLGLNFIFGVGAAFVFARTRTVVAPILLHVLWGWPIILFR